MRRYYVTAGEAEVNKAIAASPEHSWQIEAVMTAEGWYTLTTDAEGYTVVAADARGEK